MFPSWGVPRSTPTLPHQGVMMFPKTLRSIHRREEYEGEKERGQSHPRGGDPEGPGARKPYTPMFPHQGVMMFPTPPPSGVPRRGITTPPFLPIMFSMVRDYSSYSRQDICAGYAFPRGTGLPRSGVSASQRGNEAQDYRGEMNVSGKIITTHSPY
jgi:hypothetical protein